MRRNSLLHYAIAAVALCALVAGVHALGGDAHAMGYAGAAIVLSAQLSRTSDDQTRNYPRDDYGKLRIAYFYYKNETGGVLAAATEIDLIDLAPGRVQVLPNLSRYRTTAMGAARTLDIGHRAYYKDNTTTAVPENDEAFVANKDVSGAVNDVAWDGGAANMVSKLYSKAGIRLFATVDVDTIPANAIIEGYCIYVTD